MVPDTNTWSEVRPWAVVISGVVKVTTGFSSWSLNDRLGQLRHEIADFTRDLSVAVARKLAMEQLIENVRAAVEWVMPACQPVLAHCAHPLRIGERGRHHRPYWSRR